ncbi:mechanosensitive ion channel [candidate division KSB1 bacterium]|nr:mechanosensitive ion channel [candidate division KSB1 bacterium]
MTTRLFTINETPISIASVFVFVLVLSAFVIFAKFLSKSVLHRIFVRTKMEIGTQYTLRRMTEYLIMVIGAIVAFQVLGIDLSGLAVIFGLLSVGIGFGLQNITSNFISGLILLFEQPIKVGDRVTVGDTEGDVMEINMRSTTVRSLNNISIIIPNSEFIASQVINWSHSDKKVRLDIDVGVSYNSNLDHVLQALKQVANENPEVLAIPEPEVHLREFGDSSWNMRLRIWIENPKRHPYVRSAINCAIVRIFRKKNIEIPFPQRDLHMRSPLPLPLSKEQVS